ncbi:MAG: tRNA(Ile)-lysidine synthase [Alphaproteobacteria bacterium]|jgi:tRNA(Ile)-lysidine synthase
MDRVGPFEPCPEIAIACSGGADSMALAVLAADWARRRKGQATALIVDHGLRAESVSEAASVRRRLKGLGIGAHILRWAGEKPTTGIQQAAREARYGLMERWCWRHAVLHLAVAHHLEDQAETVLHRFARGSGPDGLAGMAAIRETQSLRLLRPFLGTPRARLRATLHARGIDWVEDPSNQDPAYARVRLRALAPTLTEIGLGPQAINRQARQFAIARQALDGDVADALANCGALHVEGYATLARGFFSDTRSAVALRGLNSLLCCVGGRTYPVRQERLGRLYSVLADPTFVGTRTLAGCTVRMGREQLVIAREAGRILPVSIHDGEDILWDQRFRVRLLRRVEGRQPRRFTLAPFDPQLLVGAGRDAARVRASALPSAVRLSLPALYDRRGLVAVPHLNYGRAARNTASVVAHMEFLPARPVTFAVFSVV